MTSNNRNNGKYLLIENVDLGKSICSKLNTERVIGLDCEGVDLGPTGNLTLVQISTPDTKSPVYVFDLVACPELIDTLKPILESTTILKIIHDCRGERSNLQTQFGIQLRNVFDTQIGFHFMKPFKNDRISLTNLSKYFQFPQNQLKGEFQTDFYEANPGFWARRPLTDKMTEYAAADVANLHLFYEKLKRHENNPQFRRRCEAANLLESDLYDETGQRNQNLRFFV